ncbi:hypothetical protein, partial [Paenibacillus sp. 32O-W]|uniref:hypothetical protein n=1 Tax=Paenibacillus sp. 32O-W TaxID=1695218 RepID=UPI001C92BB3F
IIWCFFGLRQNRKFTKDYLEVHRSCYIGKFKRMVETIKVNGKYVGRFKEKVKGKTTFKLRIFGDNAFFTQTSCIFSI